MSFDVYFFLYFGLIFMRVDFPEDLGRQIRSNYLQRFFCLDISNNC